MMPRQLLLAFAAVLALAGCGRPAKPVATQQSHDQQLSCAQIASEMKANGNAIAGLNQELGGLDESNAAAVFGAILAGPGTLMAIDDGEAANSEIAGYRSRNARLEQLAAAQGCGNAAQASGAAAPSATADAASPPAAVTAAAAASSAPAPTPATAGPPPWQGHWAGEVAIVLQSIDYLVALTAQDEAFELRYSGSAAGSRQGVLAADGQISMAVTDNTKWGFVSISVSGTFPRFLVTVTSDYGSERAALVLHRQTARAPQ